MELKFPQRQAISIARLKKKDSLYSVASSIASGMTPIAHIQFPPNQV